MLQPKINWQPLSLLLIVIVLALVGCGNQAPAAEITSPDTLNLPVNVDVATVEKVRHQDDVVLLDVREDWEYAEGHIPGAVLVPLGQIPDRLDEIPQDKTVIAVCRSGNRMLSSLFMVP